MVTTTALEAELLELAGSVPDPELPVVTLAELGVVRGVRVTAPGRVEVELTPTYTGCPAVEAMSADIERVLHDHGIPEVEVRRVLSPAWTTDAISAEGRRKLAEFGIAPPRPVLPTAGSPSVDGAPAPAAAGPRGTATRGGGPIPVDLAIRCPHCGSTDTALLSRFSSTACKALRRCESCREPFDHFKEV
ncbi:1,2-phenylacetyl-CoA epoxidase subunit PaaD [Streptomyces sp. MST-110588]|uniref:1,2-phenylacetyl-CoA epoxidase subunit PaaD n=1 Tax=Streptomyces sp. MST-110588 TaxID=2833628 RepID=UPI001F5E1B06|nr:1,2-phenylacetyl-CoA epoxidase subunit PaaD [Streptomyces sp. MST-110588]UNO41002.1 phenylacetate-CoA oxygenase subunit PaaJ [Streptomyces sp. MST-110588]